MTKREYILRDIDLNELYANIILDEKDIVITMGTGWSTAGRLKYLEYLRDVEEKESVDVPDK